MITVDTLRALAANRTITLNAAGDDLVENKTFQRFRSFFNIGTARAENRQTLDAIRTAILNDPRFSGFGEELAAEKLDRLLGEVRTDRAIKSGQITSILKQMDAFAAEPKLQWKALHLRMNARLAATPRPPALAQLTDSQYAEIAKKVLCTTARGLPSPGALDVPGTIAQLNEKLEALMPRINQTPFVSGILMKNVSRHFMVPLSELTERIESKVAAFENALTQLPETPDAEDAGRYRECCIDMMRALEKPLDPRLFQVLKNFTDQVPLTDLQTLIHSPGPHAAEDILHAVSKFLSAVQDNAHLATFYPEGMEPLNGGDESTALVVFTTYTALLRLPAEDRAALHGILGSPAGQNVSKLYLSANSNQFTQGNGNALNTLRESLVRHEGLPQIENDPSPVDLGAFSAQTLTDLSPMDFCFTGNYGSAIREHLTHIPPNIDNPESIDLSRAPTAANFKRAVLPSVRTMVATTLAYDMQAAIKGENTHFKGDLPRLLNVILPDGSQLPKDYGAALDRLAALVTGNPQTTFEQAPQDVRNRVYLITSLLSQETEKAVEAGIPIAINDQSCSPAIDTANRPGTEVLRTFRLALNDDGGVAIRYERHSELGMLSRSNDEECTPVGEGSFADYSLSIDIPGAEVDRLIHADWQGADFTVLSERLGNPQGPGDYGNLYYAVPASCRLDAQIDFGIHIHAVSA